MIDVTTVLLAAVIAAVLTFVFYGLVPVAPRWLGKMKHERRADRHDEAVFGHNFIRYGYLRFDLSDLLRAAYVRSEQLVIQEIEYADADIMLAAPLFRAYWSELSDLPLRGISQGEGIEFDAAFLAWLEAYHKDEQRRLDQDNPPAEGDDTSTTYGEGDMEDCAEDTRFALKA